MSDNHPVKGKFPIDRPCSACSGGDPTMEYHDHAAPFREGYGPAAPSPQDDKQPESSPVPSTDKLPERISTDRLAELIGHFSAMEGKGGVDTVAALRELRELRDPPPPPPPDEQFPVPCGLCPANIESLSDREWHGLGNCVPICERCTGSGIEPAPAQQDTDKLAEKIVELQEFCESHFRHNVFGTADKRGCMHDIPQTHFIELLKLVEGVLRILRGGGK